MKILTILSIFLIIHYSNSDYVNESVITPTTTPSMSSLIIQLLKETNTNHTDLHTIFTILSHIIKDNNAFHKNEIPLWEQFFILFVICSLTLLISFKIYKKWKLKKKPRNIEMVEF